MRSCLLGSWALFPHDSLLGWARVGPLRPPRHGPRRLFSRWEIVGEEPLRAWVSDEHAGRQLNVPLDVARTLREEAGQAFLQWLEEGE